MLWLYETNKENLQLTVLVGKQMVIFFFFLEAANGNIDKSYCMAQKIVLQNAQVSYRQALKFYRRAYARK